VAKTNPIPKGTRNITTNVRKKVALAIERLARRSAVSRNAYCAAVLARAIKEGVLVRKIVEVDDGSLLSVPTRGAPRLQAKNRMRTITGTIHKLNSESPVKRTQEFRQ
jgi:hypothetical protein